ncbi:MMPL family transporter [Paenibacillus sp. NPDC056933]|uniref:MMPL family transporter n=1 Tax=Paenibacillus sp. NPDC056933 TaxID=3345968 RepID=UPI0036431B25
MKKLINGRSISLLFWVLVTVVALVSMPDLNRLVKDKGQISIPQSAQSKQANSMLSEMKPGEEDTESIILVFNSGNEKALNDTQKKEINQAITNIKQNKVALGLKEVVSYLDGEEEAKRLVSEDKTTILTNITIANDENKTIDQVASVLKKEVEISNVKTYLTGSNLISSDFGNSIEEGVKKTEVIAVVFILAILIVVFQSPVIPIISLLTVGISYLVSLSIIGHLVDVFNYPFSNFTQVFLVVVLFGIGTDYNILLYTRFKEELSKSDSVLEAVKVTFKSAGKTVLFSGLAVFIGFLVLLFANFQLYQATSAVAFGVAILIIVLNTLNPFFMALLGKKMFWPSKKFSGHGDNRLWGWLSKQSVLRPLIAILLITVISVPFFLSYSKQLSYNDLAEVSDSYTSKKGINIISEHFTPGLIAPVSLVIKSDTALDQQGTLKVLDELAEQISKTEGISKVYSATRPSGEKIQDLYLNDQTGKVNEGVGKANSGVGTIEKGLSSATKQLKPTEDLENVKQLINGTDQLTTGVTAIKNALGEITIGLNGGVSGVDKIHTGLTSLQKNVEQLETGTKQLEQGYNKLEQGLSTFGEFFNVAKTSIKGALNGYAKIQTSMSQLVTNNPTLAQDAEVQKVIGISTSAQQQLNELYSQIDPLMEQYNVALESFKTANTSLVQVTNGLGEVNKGISQLQQGTKELKTGLKNGAEGSEQIATKTSDVVSGLKKVGDGQEQLYSGLQELQNKMKELQEGLGKSTKGLVSISDGLNDTSNYLNNLSQSSAAQSFYIPKEVLKGTDFKQSLDTYMSGDRKITEFSIVLKNNPYSKEAMEVVKNLNNQLNSALAGTELANAQLAVGGITQQNLDMEKIAGGDFGRTSIIMLSSIGLMLIIVTRSFWPPIFIIGSLYLSYKIALGANEWLSTHLLGVDYLSWNVPFFTFIMIVALGVDYSIFLMMRYREIEGSPSDAIKIASKNIGGVVISAAVILGGTFAALIPSGVVTLIEVAIGVIIGLVLLSILILPILFPALMNILDRSANLQKKKQNKENELQG